MRAMALIAVLALPLAACGETPDDSVYAEPITTLAKYSPNESVSKTETAIRNRWEHLEEKYGLTRSEYQALSEEERHATFAPISSRPAPATPDEEFKPMLR